VATALAMTMFSGSYPSISIHAIVQISVVFLLLHSIRWNSNEPFAENLLRAGTAGIWLLDTAIWTSNLQLNSFAFSSIAAAVVFLACSLCRGRAFRILAFASLAVVCCAPAHWLSHNASAGAMALLGSLALFAIGMIVAWTRHRWDNRDQTTPQ
jgi:membrane-associated PAP2 superfamily phosphatase